MDVLAAKGDDVAEVDIDLKRQPRSGNFCVQRQADAAVLFLEACRLTPHGLRQRFSYSTHPKALYLSQRVSSIGTSR